MAGAKGIDRERKGEVKNNVGERRTVPESESITPRGDYLGYAPCWWHWCEDVAGVTCGSAVSLR